MINILATQYTLEHKSLDIYIAGCKGINGQHCPNCHNPESWNFNQGTQYSLDYFIKINEKINDFDSMIDNIMLFGGEPLDQNINELIHLLMDLKSLNKKIWLFTRYNFEDIPNEALKLCDYVKTGQYIEELRTDDNVYYGLKLATSNQKIHKTNN